MFVMFCWMLFEIFVCVVLIVFEIRLFIKCCRVDLLVFVWVFIVKFKVIIEVIMIDLSFMIIFFLIINKRLSCLCYNWLWKLC